MARRYSVRGAQTTASPDDSSLGYVSTAAVRNSLYDVTFGFTNTPADRAYTHTVQSTDTAAGTGGSNPVPTPLDSGDPVAVGTYAENYSIEPTLTANAFFLQIAANMRATYRWVAAPGGEIVTAATTTDGLVVFATGNTADEHLVTIHFSQ